MALGSPLAFVIGGAPDPALSAYDALKSSVGQGGSADGGPRETKVEAWRYARARGLAAVCDDLRAAAQVSPALATDLIPAFEQMTGAYSPSGAPDQDRRDATAAAWTEFVQVDGPDLLAALREIHPDFELITRDRDQQRETQHGRAFEDWDPASPSASGPAFNISGFDRRSTEWPNYSDDFVVLARLPHALTGFTPQIARAMARARLLLDKVLPAWVDFQVTGRSGFILDVSQLDVTALDP